MTWTLVTGGSRRLGAHLCKALAQAGHDIVVHYRQNEKEASETAEICQRFGVRTAVIAGDFSSDETIRDFIGRYSESFPETRNIINNVGNYLVGSALNTSLDEWVKIFQTNLHAPFALIKALSPSIIKQKGVIINIGVSGLNSFHASTYSTAYQISKLSLLALTRALAKEMAVFGVRVNMVSPGYLDLSIDLPDDSEKIPMRRTGTCEEVGRIVTFLMDSGSEYITGQNIEIAGGVGL